jgi:hypothetical protein
MRKLLIPFFVLISCISLKAQITLTGSVLNDKDHLPVVFASVYISGTSIGTYTDSNGRFTLHEVSIPCQLVVSHIAFNLQLIPIDKMSELTLFLTGKAKQLTGVSVSGSSKRKLNVKDFKDAFLGNDHWGRNALMKNDSVLIFSRVPDTLVLKANATDFEKKKMNASLPDNDQWSDDSSHIVRIDPKFSAKTISRLLIELPLLGYHVYIDLVSFSLKNNKIWSDCSYMAYYHFIAETNTTAHQQAIFEKNRQEVYYNSSKHFCKALFDNQLKENGYLISVSTFSDVLGTPSQRKIFDLNEYVTYLNPNEVRVTGLKNKKLNIYYLCKSNGKPTNLTLKNKKTGIPKIEWSENAWENNSYVLFKSDTCIIRSNGTIPDTNIRFGGKIASKRGGALLPVEYFP